jgi:processive 1,2-diacylglycerol beta-glucosyltransferase
VLVTKAGGITVSEALAKSLPMVIYKPAPGQEEVNANYLWRHHAAIIAGGERRLKTAVQRIVTDHNFQLRLRRHCGKIGKPDAALVSAFMILRMIRSNVKPTGFYQKSLRREARA